MKAIDTNVLVRFLVADDPAQSSKVRDLLENAERQEEVFLITIPVLLETIWVLESSYGCPRATILDALEQLSLMPVIQIESRERIMNLISQGRKESLGLSDLLIGLTAKELGCETTLTFDKRAAKSGLFQGV